MNVHRGWGRTNAEAGRRTRHLTRRLPRTEKKISWTVLYDERINIGTRAVPALSAGPSRTSPRTPTAVPAAGSLTADFLGFLSSPAVVAQLRDTSYISCSDLAGSRLSGSRLSGACDQ